MIFHCSLPSLASIINILLLLNMRCEISSQLRSRSINFSLRLGEITWSKPSSKNLSKARRQREEEKNLKIFNWQRFKKRANRRKKNYSEKRTHNYRNNEKCFEEIEEKSSINRSCTNTLECLFRFDVIEQLLLAKKNKRTKYNFANKVIYQQRR